MNPSKAEAMSDQIVPRCRLLGGDGLNVSIVCSGPLNTETVALRSSSMPSTSPTSFGKSRFTNRLLAPSDGSAGAAPAKRVSAIKLGGNPPLVVYGWFDCEIGEDDIVYVLEKTTGSQRLSGHFIDDAEASLVFYGARHYSDERPKRYGAEPERDAVGRLVKVGERRYRLELPLPQLESKFDIIELEAR